MQIPAGWRLVREAPNGVRHYHASCLPESKRGGEVYELPPGQDGVARTITCISRRWWRGGKRWKAEDSQGHGLSMSRWEHVVSATDPTTGLQTTLNTQTLQVRVDTALLTQMKPIPYGLRHVDQRAVQETLEPDGSIDVISSSLTTTERTTHRLGIQLGARPTVTNRQHSHDHTHMSPQGVVDATTVTEPYMSRPVSLPVAAHLSADGTLRIENDVVHLPIAPAAIVQRQHGRPVALNSSTMESAVATTSAAAGAAAADG